VTGRLFPRGAEAPCRLPIPLWESGTPNSLKTKSGNFKEVLDSIVDGFGSNVQTVTIDEYAVRLPYRRYGRAPLLRVALAECFQVLSHEIAYSLHRILRSGNTAAYI
jgi:hypothetical protein